MGWETVGIRTALCVAGMIRGELMARTFDQGNWKEIVFQYLFETFSNHTAKPQSPQSPPPLSQEVLCDLCGEKVSL